MASKKTSTKPYTPKEASEQLDELASFLYDAYQHSKEKDSDKMVLEKGQVAEYEENTK